MKKLPKLYKGDNCSHINNNKTIFYSENETVSKKSPISFDDYLFNIPVEIDTKNRIIKCKIVSKVGDHILTSNNEKIYLTDIESIKKQR